jgi:hypothetical protein
MVGGLCGFFLNNKFIYLLLFFKYFRWAMNLVLVFTSLRFGFKMSDPFCTKV